jgi:predicted N-acetyltransferase YhbS
VVARVRDGSLAGFVNVAWDGSDHAFLVDTKVRADLQRQGIGQNLVRLATQHARSAGCEWLHVDYTQQLTRFYVKACGFRPAPAGLIHLPSL